jgi:hypothetical protein
MNGHRQIVISPAVALRGSVQRHFVIDNEQGTRRPPQGDG